MNTRRGMTHQMTRLPIALLFLAAPAGCGDAAQPRPAAGGGHFTTVDGAPARPKGRWLTARLTEPVRMRATPGGRRLRRLTTRTEFGSPKVVSVVGRRAGWLRV